MHIHYFQRYHSKENVDTSNTMLMLSRLYSYSPDKFYAFLKDLILPNDSEPELSFVLQEKSRDSVPDATLTQKSFKIAVETKLYNQFDVNQLKNHLQTFGSEEYKVLLTLDPRPMKDETKKQFEAVLDEYNQSATVPVFHKNLTFEELIEGLKSVIDERDYELVAVLDDFEQYCFSGHLIPEDDKWMRVMTAGTTFRDNMELNLYYDGADRGFSNHAYIGLYTQKSVRGIGKIYKVVVGSVADGKLITNVEDGEPITDEEKARIMEAIHRAKAYGYDLSLSHRYFMVDRFYETDFRKATPNPIQRSKFFDLKDLLRCKKLPPIEEIAQRLMPLSW